MVLAWGPLAPLLAQQATVETSASTVQGGFSERYESNWGVRGPGFLLDVGAPVGMPAGSASIAAGATSGPWSAHFAFGVSQDMQSTAGWTGPTLNMTNGTSGYMVDAVQSPFVISVMPVVGAAEWPIEMPQSLPSQPAAELRIDPPQSVQRATRQPSPSIATMSVADARRLRAAEHAGLLSDAVRYVQQGDRALARGKPTVAAIFYRMALHRAPPSYASTVEAKLSGALADPRSAD
ncbi:MAG TPA: hypothetical protein VG713_06045 [Pirellulales bacterium]|nr:hypothetical protein [Pirellulales bacterium]